MPKGRVKTISGKISPGILLKKKIRADFAKPLFK